MAKNNKRNKSKNAKINKEINKKMRHEKRKMYLERIDENKSTPIITRHLPANYKTHR